MTAPEQGSSVAAFYAGQNVFITGATGFMGKILIEKLLRSCPNIGALYLLVRAKKGRRPSERIDDIINCPVFDMIRDQHDGEHLFEKLKCVSGDVTQESLDLSNDDLKDLQDNVTMVFHMAANVRFDQPLKPAVNLNTAGTKNLLDVCCSFQKLKAFIHVSTSYCHCDEVELQEKLYKAPNNPKNILDMVSWMDDDLLSAVTPKLLKNSPNTYAYTKCLTEQLVSEYSAKLPLVITRPSIVTATWKEPIPGWVDNLNGPTGLLVGAGKGVIRTMHCDADQEADVVPVDSVINSLIIIGWKIATSQKSDQVAVYNVTANKKNPVCWGEALRIGRKHFFDNPFSVCLWYPGGTLKSNYFLHMLAVFFFHIIPAYMIDFIMILIRQKPFLVRTQKRIQNGLEVLQYYTTRDWYFHNENFGKLWMELSEKDKEIFYTVQHHIDYNEYMLAYVLGARKYCMHEGPETLPYARKLMKRLFYLDLCKNIVLGLLLFWIVYRWMSFDFLDNFDFYPSYFNSTTSGVKHRSLGT